MTDWRRYTGTRFLQIAWTVGVGGLVALLKLVVPVSLPTVITVGGGSVLLLAGLVGLGLRERRHWNRLVRASSYDKAPAGHTADLQGIVQGTSVTVTTDVTGLLSAERTQIRAPVEGVDADFRVRIEAEELADTGGLQTGIDALDDRFVIRGAEGNVAAILSESVCEALLAVDVPGTYTILPDRVVFEVPFTNVTVTEVEAAGDAVARLARRVETVAGSR